MMLLDCMVGNAIDAVEERGGGRGEDDVRARNGFLQSIKLIRFRAFTCHGPSLYLYNSPLHRYTFRIPRSYQIQELKPNTCNLGARCLE